MTSNEQPAPEPRRPNPRTIISDASEFSFGKLTDEEAARIADDIAAYKRGELFDDKQEPTSDGDTPADDRPGG